MLLVHVTRDGGVNFFSLAVDEEDIADRYAGDDSIRQVRVLCDDIEHHDILRLWEQSCAMQQARAESVYPDRT